jgi:hypothetical protein
VLKTFNATRDRFLTFPYFQSHDGARTMNPSENKADDSPSAVKKKRRLSETTSSTAGTHAFPWRLHDMLGAAAREGFENIVSWQPCGLAFKVNDPLNFTEYILPRYFKTTMYKSFQRQLNIYGFRRLTSGSQKGAYTHEFLIRGKPEVCRFMVRTKIHKKGSRSFKLGSRSSSNLVGHSGCGEEELCIKRTVSCPEAETLRTMANISAVHDGAPDQEFRRLTASSMNGVSNQGLFKNFCNCQTKSNLQEEEDPREKFNPGLFRRRSMMDFNPTCATADSAEIEALPFDPSNSQNPNNVFIGISNEMTGHPMDIWDLDSIFEEDNMTLLSSPHREQEDLADFPIAPHIADEIINMFS